MSAPAIKDFSPAPVMTTTRTASSCRSSSSAATPSAVDVFVECVELVGAVDGQNGDLAALFDGDSFVIDIKEIVKSESLVVDVTANCEDKPERYALSFTRPRLRRRCRRRSRRRKAAASFLWVFDGETPTRDVP